MIVNHANIRRQTARNPDNGFVKAFRDLRYPHRDFAVDRLAVDAAFAGDNQICIGHLVGQVQRIGYNLNALAQLCAAKAYSAAPIPPRRTTASKV